MSTNQRKNKAGIFEKSHSNSGNVNVLIPNRGIGIYGRKMAKENIKTNSLARLKKIEGQIRGIHKMIENDRYCIDIINQISAARKALYMVSLIVMKGHLDTCVSDSIKAGQSDKKSNELIDALYRFAK